MWGLRGDDVRARPQPLQCGCFGVRTVLWRRDRSLFVNRGSLLGSYRLAEGAALSGTGASLLWRKAQNAFGKKCRTCDHLCQHRGRSTMLTVSDGVHSAGPSLLARYLLATSEL